MSLWGSTIDPALAKEYVVPLIENQLPPVLDPEDEVTISVQPSPTRVLSKPTLPPDHGSAEGEGSKPAFGTPSSTTTSTATMTPTLDEGWVSQMSNLVSDQKWLFAAGGLVALFAIGAGIFFWRRAVKRRRANYSSLPAEDVALSSMRESRPRTKELYDAFGEVSDDEDADESTGLRPDVVAREGLGYHAGFLDDDDPQSAGPTPYRDEPSHVPPPRERTPDSNESWEHASQIR
jgi:kexin